MLVNEPNSMPYMKSLATCLNKIMAEGYAEDFKLGERGLEALQQKKVYSPEQIHLVNSFRFKGEYELEENVILYIIETVDGLKGTLIDNFGKYSDSGLNRFMASIKNIQKK
jgi:hypothetical protein